MRIYRLFDLEITALPRAGVEALAVRVSASPAGEQRAAEAARVEIGAELRRDCGRLERRELDLAGMVAVGKALGELLLPPPARELFARSRVALVDDEGLRLRLKLDTWGFADLPWEYAWLPPAASAETGPEASPDATGFLGLDPRLSITRYELLSEPIGELEPAGAKSLRVVGVFSAPKDERWVPLDLDGEERGLRSALASRPGTRLEVVAEATLANLERALLDGADVFHFAGHGRFQAAAGDRIDTIAGRGFLVFRDAAGRAAEVPAETVLVNLRGRGVRLAVLGACEGARRDRINPWTGIAPALVRGGLPAVVAMQATLYDRSAVAFSTRFYEALARGLPVDAAVTAGRIAIANENGAGERDWGVPVLYLRAESGVLFPRGEDGLAEPLPPLGAVGWTNVALSSATLAAGLLFAYLVAHPRLPESWIVGGGIVATVAAAALAWLQRLAGDELRLAARRLVARRATLVGLALLLVALVAADAFRIASPPTVLRIVPGTRLLARIGRGGVAYSVRIWQGEKDREPDWVLEPLEGAGAAVGVAPAVRRTLLERYAAGLDEALDEHLSERGVGEALRGRYFDRWRLDPNAAPSTGGTRRRRGEPLSVELLRDGEPVPATVGGGGNVGRPIAVRRAIEENVEILFVEVPLEP